MTPTNKPTPDELLAAYVAERGNMPRVFARLGIPAFDFYKLVQEYDLKDRIREARKGFRGLKAVKN